RPTGSRGSTSASAAGSRPHAGSTPATEVSTSDSPPTTEVSRTRTHLGEGAIMTTTTPEHTQAATAETIGEERLAAGRRAHELDRAHVSHSWQAQGPFQPMTIVDAAGPYVWDGEGRKLLDMSSQLVNTNIGHQHPAVVAAIQAQAGTLCTIAPQHVNEARSEAARLIAERT